jgi:hypothetical protein
MMLFGNECLAKIKTAHNSCAKQVFSLALYVLVLFQW